MTNLGPQNITLVDDGTLDRVVEFDCPCCGEHVCYRYDAEFVACYSPGIQDLVVSDWEGEECLIDH